MFVIKEGTAPDKVGEGTDETTKKSIVQFLEKSGHVIRTVDQDKEYLNSKTQESIDKVLGERASQMESTIQKVTGIAKKSGEKYYDYFERSINEKLADVATLQSKIKEYESKGVEGSTLAQQYKKELEQTQEQIKKVNEEWEKKYQGKESEVFTSKVQSEVGQSIAELRPMFRKDIEETILQDAIEGKLHKFRSENIPKNFDGHVIYTDAAGNTIKNKTDGKPKSTKELLNEYLGDLIDKSRAQGGAGSGKGGDGGTGGDGNKDSKYKDIVLPDNVKNKVQLTDYLIKEKKLDVKTKEFTEAFNILGKNLPLRN